MVPSGVGSAFDVLQFVLLVAAACGLLWQGGVALVRLGRLVETGSRILGVVEDHEDRLRALEARRCKCSD